MLKEKITCSKLTISRNLWVTTSPIDITKNIANFREFLNISWDHVIYKIMGLHNWDEDGEFIDDWMQINWELLVGRELLGKELCLSQFSSTHLSEHILYQGRKPDYVVLAHFDIGLTDIKTEIFLPKNKMLRFFSLNKMNSDFESLVFAPPFDLACLVDDDNQKLYTVPFKKLKFFLYNSKILNI